MTIVRTMKTASPFQICISFALILSFALSLPGCKVLRKPMQVRMKGEVTTKMPPDNLPSRLMAKTIDSCGCGPRVAIIDVDGLLINRNQRGFGSMNENPVALFREKLVAARKTPNLKAVVLRINSPGGGVTASDIMRNELVKFRNETGLPVVACVMDVGTAGAYYLATACDVISAHPTALTGGIGVIFNMYRMDETMELYNVLSIPVKSGEKIDLATPTRGMSEEERALLESIANNYHQRFINVVKEARPGLVMDYVEIADVEDEDIDEEEASDGERPKKYEVELFDGRVVTADAALEKGLIDQVGYLEDAITTAAQNGGISCSPQLVMFRRSLDRGYTYYDITPIEPLQNKMLPINVPGLDRASLPAFMYLWQPDPSLPTTGGLR